MLSTTNCNRSFSEALPAGARGTGVSTWSSCRIHGRKLRRNVKHLIARRLRPVSWLQLHFIGFNVENAPEIRFSRLIDLDNTLQQVDRKCLLIDFHRLPLIRQLATLDFRL